MKRKLALMTLTLAMGLSNPLGVLATETEAVFETENYEELKRDFETLQKDYDELTQKYEDVLAKLEELQGKESDLPKYDISGVVNSADSSTFTITTEKGNTYTFNADNSQLNIGETVSFKYTGEIESANEIQAGTVTDLTVTAAAPAGAEYETGITYDNLSRNPDEYKGKLVKFQGKVVQLIEDISSDEIQIRFAVDGNYDKMLYCGYDKTIVNSRILEDDTITIYGTSIGLISYESTMGGTITIPAVYIDLIEQ